MTKRLSYTSQARSDFIDISIRVADAAESDAAGESVIEALDEKCVKLAGLPGTLGRPRPEIADGLRSFPFRTYVIFFRYHGEVFEVVRVLDGRRDIDAAFRDE